MLVQLTTITTSENISCSQIKKILCGSEKLCHAYLLTRNMCLRKRINEHDHRGYICPKHCLCSARSTCYLFDQLKCNARSKQKKKKIEARALILLGITRRKFNQHLTKSPLNQNKIFLSKLIGFCNFRQSS